MVTEYDYQRESCPQDGGDEAGRSAAEHVYALVPLTVSLLRNSIGLPNAKRPDFCLLTKLTKLVHVVLCRLARTERWVDGSNDAGLPPFLGRRRSN